LELGFAQSHNFIAVTGVLATNGMTKIDAQVVEFA
jgi:hypothetical protein